MKTRKVGRVLSLLLAIAMVVGLMIPASSVLAETTKVEEVSSLSSLKTALDNASKNPESPTKIKLVGDISVPIAKYLSNETSFGKVKGYLSSSAASGETEDSYASYLAQYFTDQADKNTYPMRTYVFNRSYYSKKQAYERYYAYEDVTLTVPEGSYVELDLNGHKISLTDGNKTGWQWRGDYNDPNPFQSLDSSSDRDTTINGVTSTKGGFSSVITVKGKLTLRDTAGGGKLTGGTGNVLEANDMTKVLKKTYAYKVEIGGKVYEETPLLTGRGTPGVAAITDSKNYGITNDVSPIVYKNAQVNYYDMSEGITRVCGGGVYVADNAEFVMESGAIEDNTAWISEKNRDLIVKTSSDLYALGGGVYVSDGATFTMTGGSITGNVAKSYNKASNAYMAISQGGGVYLASGAKMNFYGGNVDENSTYANVKLSSYNNSYSEGGGIYVSEGAVINMMGTKASDNRTDWPSVSGNTSGGYLVTAGGSSGGGYLFVQGAGMQICGTANISRAIITANSFPCVTKGNPDIDEISINVVERDESDNRVVYRNVETGQAVDASGKRYEDDDENVAVGLVNVTAKDTWLFGTGSDGNAIYANGELKGGSYLNTNGAGINLNHTENDNDFTGVLNIGERVWCYDNWDLTTNLSADKTGTSVSHDDVALCKSKTAENKWQYIGCAAPATESKIGVNFIAGVDSTQDGVQGNVIAKKANTNSLDSSVWGEYQGYEPTLTDVQFFFDNGGNDDGSGYTMNGDYEIKSATYTNAPSKTVIFEPSSENGKRLLDHSGLDALGFGNTSDGYNGSAYKTFVMLNFNEADVHKYAQFTSVDGNMKGEWGDTYKTTAAEQWLTKNDTEFGVQLPRPNYSLYNGTNWASLTTYDNHTVGEAGAKNSIATQNGTERADLYFKGYQFYSPYGHFEGLLNYVGKTTEDNRNDIELPGLLTHTFTGNDLLTWNDNKLHISVPAYTAMWYTADELADARTRVSNVKAQAVVLADGSKAIRFIALVDSRYAEYDEAGFVFSLNNATPTVEGGYDFSSKSKIYKKVMTKTSANPDGEWIDVYYMMHPDETPAGTMKVDWTEFSDAKGILYTNIIVNDASTSTVYYATPYVRTGTTYYYGESRAISYDWLTQQDAASANS
ncbi:MAG: hypothetical protein ACI4JR_07870 [Acutalibacteraceae bacterium]